MPVLMIEVQMKNDLRVKVPLKTNKEEKFKEANYICTVFSSNIIIIRNILSKIVQKWVDIRFLVLWESL